MTPSSRAEREVTSGVQVRLASHGDHIEARTSADCHYSSPGDESRRPAQSTDRLTHSLNCNDHASRGPVRITIEPSSQGAPDEPRQEWSAAMRYLRLLGRVSAILALASALGATALGQANLPAESIGGPLSGPPVPGRRFRRTRRRPSTPSWATAADSTRARRIGTTVILLVASAWRGR